MAYKAIYTGEVNIDDLKMIIKNFLKKYKSGKLIKSRAIVRALKNPDHKGATIYICKVSEINYVLAEEKVVTRICSGTYKIL